MAIDYSSFLTNEQKRNILQQRIAQFASEAYQHEINKSVAESSGNEDGIKTAEEALAIYEVAINVHQEELTKLQDIE